MCVGSNVGEQQMMYRRNYTEFRHLRKEFRSIFQRFSEIKNVSFLLGILLHEQTEVRRAKAVGQFKPRRQAE